MRKTPVNHRGGGTVILPTEEPTVQQSNQSTAAPEQTGEDAPASPSATAEASADSTAAPAVTADPSAAPTPATDAEETPVPDATATPEATADPSASPSSAPVLKAPMMAPADETVSQEDVSELVPGSTFNMWIKGLAGTSWDAPDYNIKAFARSSSAPASGVTTQDISNSRDGSIVAWFDSSTGTVYWYSSANELKLNKYSDEMFENMRAIKSIDTEDFDTSNVTSMGSMFSVCQSLTSLDVSNWDVSSVTYMERMFESCNNLTSLDTSKWNVSKVKNMHWMFYDCKNLPTINVSNWDVSSVTMLNGMFYYCENLTSLDVSKWNTSNVTNMGEMFYHCHNLTSLDVSNWDVSSVEQLFHMFYDCENLTSLDVSKWNTSNVKDMGAMFHGCKNLTSLDVSKWNVEKVWDLADMFYNCKNLTSLDVSKWNTSSLITMASVFEGCENLTSLDVSNWDVSRVKQLVWVFKGCKSLTSLDVSNWDVGSADDMTELFKDCQSLTTIDLSKWDTGKVRGMIEMFNGCSGLRSMMFGSKFVVPSTYNRSMFPTPVTTVSGARSNGNWGRDSENASPSYDADGLRDHGKTVGNLTGTWYAQTDENVATITFDVNGGNPLPVTSKFVRVGKEYGDLPTPTHTGYTFSGWYTAASGGTKVTSETECTGSTTIYAGWEPKGFTVNFVANLPENETANVENMPAPEVVKFNGQFSRPVSPSYKNGDKVFQGWYFDQECTQRADWVLDMKYDDYFLWFFGNGFYDFTFYAGWDDSEYTLAYDANGGAWADGSTEKKVETSKNVQQTILENTPTKTGYDFDFWQGSKYYPGDPYDGPKNKYGRYIDHNLTAQWKPKVYMISFNGNSLKAANVPESESETFDESTIAKPDTSKMTNEGKTFTGWYLDSACTKPFAYFGQVMDADTVTALGAAIGANDTITLYAGWKSDSSSTSGSSKKTTAAPVSSSAVKFIPKTGAVGENNN